MTVSFTLISEAQLIGAIRRVAAENPEYVYEGDRCTYRPNKDNDCGCLIGEALTRLGVQDGVLASIDKMPVGVATTLWGAEEVQTALRPYLTPEALNSLWVYHVQRWQDGGSTWGEAIVLADQTGRVHGWVIQ
jgi:hypothetical protein